MLLKIEPDRDGDAEEWDREWQKKNRESYQISAALTTNGNSTNTTHTHRVHAIKMVRKSCVGLNILYLTVCICLQPYFQLVDCLLRINAMLLNAEPIRKKWKETVNETEKNKTKKRAKNRFILLFFSLCSFR